MPMSELSPLLFPIWLSAYCLGVASCWLWRWWRESDDKDDTLGGGL